MPAPTVTLIPDNVRGRIILDVSGVESDIVSAMVYRNTGTTNRALVRNGDPFETGGGDSFLLSDWEAAPSTTVSYTLDFLVAAGTTKYTVTTGTAQWVLPWPYNCRLLHPTVPALSHNSIIAELGQLIESAPTALHYPLGRASPIVVAQVRHLPTGALKLLVLSEDDYAGLELIMRQAAVLCLQTPVSDLLGDQGQFWFTAAEMAQTRLGWPEASTRLRHYDLSVAQVDRPPGDVIDMTATWADVVETYATWTVVVADNDSWTQLVLGLELAVP